MWNARMLPALRAGAIDVGISLCPEIAAGFSYETIRTEPVNALLAAGHRLAGERAIELGALAEDGFLMFPRELAPRLYDFLVGLCRRAGFEPVIRSESFHSGWELQILGEVPVVALVPASVTRAAPEGMAAVEIASPPDRLETATVWRADDDSPAGAAFRAVANELFAKPQRLSIGAT
jgi:DNA-binding transcriptional LysR family regulator